MKRGISDEARTPESLSRQDAERPEQRVPQWLSQSRLGQPPQPSRVSKTPWGHLDPREVERLMHDSEHCHGCRRVFYHAEPATIGYDAERRLLMVGECCIGLLVSRIALTVYYAPDLPALRA